VVRRRQSLLALGAALCPMLAEAHGSRVGDLTVDHPYATPTPAGARTGAAYLRGLINRGKEADYLIAAATPRAESVEFHRSTLEGGVMRMRAVDAIEIPPGAELKLRHDGGLHLMLVGLKEPLLDGQRFPMRLRFRHAGEIEVMVWVQKPQGRTAHAH